MANDLDHSSAPFLAKVEEGLNTHPHTESTLHPPLARKHVFSYINTIKIVIWFFATWGFASMCSRLFRPFWHPSIRDVYRPETLPSELNLCDCGQTVMEAVSRDCTYDSLATAWLPPYCRDEELTVEFDKAGPGPGGEWEYFADENGTQPLGKEEIAILGETGGSFWSSRDWHIAHCVFYWQKYRRMEQTGAVMERRFDGIHHVKHCSQLIRNPVPDYFFLIEVPVMMNSDPKNLKPTKISPQTGGSH